MPPIRSFSAFINQTALEPLTLQGSRLVVDATNYFFNSYDDSGLPIVQYGLESDLYADYLKDQLRGFQRADMECYFVFKGGCEDVQRQRAKNKKPRYCRPIFMQEIYYEVLEEMGFKYGVCETESKAACVSLAQVLDCPILSRDSEYCFQPRPYIPRDQVQFTGSAMECKVFRREQFLKKYRLEERQLALFRTLTDELYFPLEFFHGFMRKMKITTNVYRRHECLLRWISLNKKAESHIAMSLSETDHDKFYKAIDSALVMQGNTNAVDWFLERKPLPGVGEPGWLEASIYTNRIDSFYVNLARSKDLKGFLTELDRTDEDPMEPCLHIYQYVLDLLTDYDNEGFVFWSRGREEKVFDRLVPKPEDMLNKSATFLFEHWVKMRLKLTAEDIARLNDLPRDSGILVMSLVLCSDTVSNWSDAAAYSSILRHVLGPMPLPASEVDIDDIEGSVQSHVLMTAQHCLQQIAALRRVCDAVARRCGCGAAAGRCGCVAAAGRGRRWRDVGRASNAAKALAILSQNNDPLEGASNILSTHPVLLEEFEQIVDLYTELWLSNSADNCT